MMKKILIKPTTLLTLQLFIFIYGGAKPLNGIYTIDKSGKGNYTSFRLAVNDLNTLGVSGPVIFNVAKGKYKESIEIDSVPGVSAINNIVFQSKGLDSTLVTLDTSFISSTFGVAHVILFNHASYVNFRKMTISNFGGGSTKTGLSSVIFLRGNSNHIILENNRIFTNGDDTDYGGVIYNNGNCIYDYGVTSDSCITIRANHISGGVTAIVLSGWDKGAIIEKNIIDRFYRTAIVAFFQNNLTISSNKIFAAGWERFGINIAYDTIYGATDSSYIVNNFIFENDKFRGDAIDIAKSTGLNVYNNTLLGSVGIEGYPSNHVNLVNNIINCIYIFSNVYSDYNVFFSSYLTFGGQWKKLPFVINDFSDWKSITSLDKHSSFGNPHLKSLLTGDLHATDSSFLLNNKGVYLSSIKTDIDGQARNPCHADIGADEFASDSNDIGISAILTPTNGSCGDTASGIKIRVTNWGRKAQINNFKIHLKMSGARTDSAIIPFKGTLLPQHDYTANLSFSPPLNTIKGGKYFFKAYTELSKDSVHCNDTMMVSDSFAPVPVAGFSLSSSSFCAGGPIKINDTARGSGRLLYYYSLLDQNDSIIDTSSAKNPVFITYLAGIYRIKQSISTTSGCRDTFSVPIKIYPASDARFSYKKSLGTFSFFAVDSTLANYIWSFGDKDSGSGYKPIHKYTSDGKYTVILSVTNSAGCRASGSDTFNVVITGLDNYGANDLNQILLFPNPAGEETGIKFKESFSGNIRLYSMDGKMLLYRKIVNSSYEKISLKTLSKGSYLLKIEKENGQEIKLVKLYHL
jgi:PKD repeat protein